MCSFNVLVYYIGLSKNISWNPMVYHGLSSSHENCNGLGFPEQTTLLIIVQSPATLMWNPPCWFMTNPHFSQGNIDLGYTQKFLGNRRNHGYSPSKKRVFLQVFPSFLAAGSSFAALGLCLAVSECCQVRDQPKQLVDYEYGILWDLAINNRDLMGFNGI